MKYSIDKKEQYVIFTPQESKIDSLLAPKLKSELLTVHAEGYDKLVLDMSQVSYVDSSGLSALLVGDREFGNNGGLFLIVGVQDHVMKLLKISMLDKKLKLVSNLEEAGEVVFMHAIEHGESEEEEEEG